jgi:LPS export ABC transporter protein LptC
MRRKWLRAALLVVVAVALTGIGYLVNRSVSARRPHTILDLGDDFLPHVAQHIQHFRRVKMEHGRRTWEINARDAQYFEQSKEIIVHEPHMTFFLEKGDRQVHVSGVEGHLTLDGRELRAFTLKGNVTVQVDDIQIETEEATYDRTQDLLTAPSLVTLHGRTLDVRGVGMVMHVGPQQVRLLGDVHTVVKSNAPS